MTTKLPPLPKGDVSQRPSAYRNIDNRPSWMKLKGGNNRVKPLNINHTPQNNQHKKGRMWIFSANILFSNTSSMAPPIPLDVNNVLPGIELWFSDNEKNEVGSIFLMNKRAAMNMGNLAVYKWLMMTHPHLVVEYMQFDDCWSVEPLQLHCAVEDLVQAEPMHMKLTTIVRYWLRYKQDEKQIILSFGLEYSVTVNSIVGIPTIESWRILLSFESHELIACGITTKFRTYL